MRWICGLAALLLFVGSFCEAKEGTTAPDKPFRPGFPECQDLIDHPLDLSGHKLKLVYENTFDRAEKMVTERELCDPEFRRRLRKPADEVVWVVEGNGTATIRNGRMYVTPFSSDAKKKGRSHMVVWNNRVFPEDVLIEFSMKPENSLRGLALVFFCGINRYRDGGVFDLKYPPRKAVYSAYRDTCAAYHMAYWCSWPNTKDFRKIFTDFTTRLRKQGTPVAVGHRTTPKTSNLANRIRILKVGNTLTGEVNGKIVLRYTDDGTINGPPLGAGRIGFRSMLETNKVSYDDFRVWHVTAKTIPAGDVHQKQAGDITNHQGSIELGNQPE